MLAAFLVATAFIMHKFWTLDDESARQGDMTHFLKDLSLCGVAVALAAFASWPLVIIGQRTDR